MSSGLPALSHVLLQNPLLHARAAIGKDDLVDFVLYREIGLDGCADGRRTCRGLRPSQPRAKALAAAVRGGAAVSAGRAACECVCCSAGGAGLDEVLVAEQGRKD